MPFTQASTTATVNRLTQLGFEVTPGTPVAATRILQAGGFDLARETDYTTYRPPGMKFDSGSAKLREWSSGSYTGGLAYNEFHIICSSALRTTTATTATADAWTALKPTQVGDMIVNTTNRFECIAVGAASAGYPYWGITGASLPTFITTTPNVSTTTDASVTWIFRGTTTGTANQWVFDMNTFSPDAVQYMTVERGDPAGTRGRRATRARLTGLSLSSSRTGDVTLSADVVGGQLTYPFTMTGALSPVTMVPATPAQFSVYMDNTSGGLGTTQIQGNTSGDFSISDRASATFFHGRSLPGIAGFVETSGMGAEANITQKDDDFIDDALLQLANGVQRFIRYEWKGPEIGSTGVKNTIAIDMCAQIGDSETESDVDGVFSVQLPYKLQHSGAWTRALQVTVKNGSTTLNN